MTAKAPEIPMVNKILEVGMGCASGDLPIDRGFAAFSENGIDLSEMAATDEFPAGERGGVDAFQNAMSLRVDQNFLRTGEISPKQEDQPLLPFGKGPYDGIRKNLPPYALMRARCTLGYGKNGVE